MVWAPIPSDSWASVQVPSCGTPPLVRSVNQPGVEGGACNQQVGVSQQVYFLIVKESKYSDVFLRCYGFIAFDQALQKVGHG